MEEEAARDGGKRPLAAGACFVCAFAWMALFPDLSLLGSVSVYAWVLVLGCGALAGAVAWWAVLRLLRGARREVAVRVCGCLAALAGFVLAFSSVGLVRCCAWAFAVVAMAPLASVQVRALRAFDQRTVAGVVFLGVAVAGLVHFAIVTLCLAVSVRSNVGAYTTMALLVLALLQCCAVIFRIRSFPLSQCAGEAPGTECAARPRKHRRFTGISLVASMLSVSVCASVFFGGFVFNPYYADPLGLMDRLAISLFIAGVLLLAVVRLKKAKAFVVAAVLMGFSLVLLLGGLLAMVVTGDTIQHGALLVMQCSRVGLLAACWIMLSVGSPERLGVRRGEALATALSGGYFALHMLGVAFKQIVGYDTTNVVFAAIALLAVLLAVFVVESITAAVVAQRIADQASRAFLDAGGVLVGVGDLAYDGLAAGAVAGSTLVVAKEDGLGKPSYSQSLAASYLASCGLTEREIDVALLFANGLTIDMCAEKLGITANTIRYHARSIYLKTSVKSKHELQKIILDLR